MPAYATDIARQTSKEMLSKLDESLKSKEKYENEKLNAIAAIKMKLKSATSKGRYDVVKQLYEQYSSYQYDSAYLYAGQMQRLATQLNSADYRVESQCAIVFCLLSAGLYNEASHAFVAIDISLASTPYRKQYYSTAARFYYDLSDYVHAAPYTDRYISQGNLYTDSLLPYLQRNSEEWLYAMGIKEMKQGHYETCMRWFEALMALPNIDTHTRAIIASCIGWINLISKRHEQAIALLAQAAIYDNESATRETTALCTLARMLYRQGDIQRATEYVRQSLANANFYGARQRVIEISGILPIIEHDRYAIVESQRNALATASVVAVLFVVALLTFAWFVRRQMNMLKYAQNVIAERKAQVEEKNMQLQEANKIKDEYIGQSFFANAEYINKVEKLYRSIDQKIAAKQFASLRQSLKESELIAERKSMFADFDKTFLNLFPTFIHQYNALFANEEDKWAENTKTLTPEMRIFALIRLGITDSERIARFLHYSIHTINTYKTRVKNKSIVDNDQFEARIMEI